MQTGRYVNFKLAAATALAAVALAVLTPNAVAADPVFAYAGQHITHNPGLLSYRDRAVAYWERQGVRVPCVPDLHLADDLEGAAGRAWIGGECQIAALTKLAGTVLHFEAHKPRSYHGRLVARAKTMQFCAVVIHEVGHVAGLANPVWDGSAWVDGHPAEHGVMNAQPTVPGECRRHARSMFPHPRR